jgi:hypothetical protein
MSATPQTMLKVVSTGLQDIERLNAPKGNPSIHQYRYVMRKRTRWASQWVRVDFDNRADFGTTATVTLPILGELITRAVLVVKLPDIFTPQALAEAAGTGMGKPVLQPRWSWTNNLGHAICSQAQFLINGSVIDEVDSRLTEVLDEFNGPTEHFNSTNVMSYRFANGYTDIVSIDQPIPDIVINQELDIVFPFWWNRGIGPQALPIQALYKDNIQISCSFLPVQQCIYTNSRRNSSPYFTGPGPLPNLTGCVFLDGAGDPIPGLAMPTSWSFQDAFWLVEYITLEDREASAFRNADLQIPFDQHVAVPVFQTRGESNVKVRIQEAGLVKELLWVGQNRDAPNYNNYFLFSRELGLEEIPDIPGAETMWWPDATISNYDYGDGYGRPAFVDRRSDPFESATLWYGGQRRFEHDGPSFFRSLMPAMNCKRCPLVDRYIYRYDFGFWSSGGLAETLDYTADEVRGAANWDKLAIRELALAINNGNCPNYRWDETTIFHNVSGATCKSISEYIGPEVAGFKIRLVGAHPQKYMPIIDSDEILLPVDDIGINPINGRGAVVEGIVDYQQIRRIPGYQDLLIRLVPDGSAALVVQRNTGSGTEYLWLAVAGAGGRGYTNTIGSEVYMYYGGDAGPVLQIGTRGGNGSRGPQSHDVSGDYGGAGGGLPASGAVGQSDGTTLPTSSMPYVVGLQSAGGSSEDYSGGDGYWGGGSGKRAGGGGGSYVSSYLREVNSELRIALEGDGELLPDSNATIRVYRRKRVPPPSLDIYVWLTRINMLRINSGRSAVLFNE